MHKYVVYNTDKTVKAEIPDLMDALKFVKDNHNGETYILEFGKTRLIIKVDDNNEINWKHRLVQIYGGKL